MPWPTIEHPRSSIAPPNLGGYEHARQTFRWEDARAELDGLPGGGLNIAHEAVDRHAAGALADRVALRWLGRKGERRDLTYPDMSTASGRFAAALAGLGIEPGERVFTLLGRVPELYMSVLGTLKRGAVLSPLFSAFGPEPIRQRLVLGDARVLVTTPTLYRRKVASIRAEVPGLQHVVLVGDGAVDGDGIRGWDELLAAHPDPAPAAPTDAEDLALLHFTSGTTGTPKGAMHVHGAVVAHLATARFALDLHDDDVFWCTADPGWVTGTSYGIIAPLVCGVTSVIDEGELDADRWYRTLQDECVTVWYTAPTAIRMLMRAGAEAAAPYDLSRLRVVASVGEPLNPEGVVWGVDVLGLPILDNWWQTETGGIMVANFAGEPVRPGSMGRPMPGIEVGVLARDERGEIRLDERGEAVLVEDPDVDGELALRPGWPSMFRGYLGEEERYARCFVGGWYHSGDVVRRDADGWLWFVARGDDVIKSSGHLIGPFEVESVLMEHAAVVEAGVIGVPDPVAGEIVKAFVSLANGVEASDELRLELIGHARTRLGPAVAPREIAFDQHLPKTRSGKIMRRVLKARELGLPEGDLTTMEESR